ncbi:hypothetical protein FS749_008206 [Ceratobasidium sp. UAMH 11750]|nr:hypothetical protein FS749_008206 [Ceratobasidium sp. UAMH 11750]
MVIIIHDNMSGALQRNKSRPGDNQAPGPAVHQDIPKGQNYSKDAAGGEPETTENGQFLELPLEIFHKIMSCLLPADVLSLARSNKSIRNLLMSRASRPLWQAAFHNIPHMPPCPQSLCEPQYASLVFSETCSTCGVKVPDGPDPYLRVRLCKPCRSKELYEFNRNIQSNFVKLVPTSHAPGHATYTLLSVFDYVNTYMALLSEDRKAYGRWRVGRAGEMREWRKHGFLLKRYLTELELEKQQMLENLLEQRQVEIERRLISIGWTKSEISLHPHTSREWRQLVRQPEPITELDWKEIYPLLNLLLWSNRAYDQAVERKKRRMDRVARLNDLITEIRQTLPPLLTVTPATGSTIPQSRRFASRANYCPVKIDITFPSMIEMMDWRFIKRLIDNDTTTRDLEAAFVGFRPKFNQAVTEWRNQVDQDLLNIRSANVSEPSTRKNMTAKGQGTPAARVSGGRMAKPSCQMIPNLSELSRAQQILLRADSRFTTAGDLCQAYPYNIPTVTQNGPGTSFHVQDKGSYGSHWDASKVKWDDVGSAIAHGILKSLGLPDATSAELGALRGNFKCGRCDTRPDSFEGILVHYRSELNKDKTVQEAKRKDTRLAVIPYNYIHDVNSDGPPIALLMTPQASAEYMSDRVGYQMHRMVCVLCEPFGERFDERYALIEGVELPLSQHLQDVHGITLPLNASTPLFQ